MQGRASISRSVHHNVFHLGLSSSTAALYPPLANDHQKLVPRQRIPPHALISILHSDDAYAHGTVSSLSLAVGPSTSSRGSQDAETHCAAANPMWRDQRGLCRSESARCCHCTVAWNHHPSVGCGCQCCRRQSEKEMLWHIMVLVEAVLICAFF